MSAAEETRRTRERLVQGIEEEVQRLGRLRPVRRWSEVFFFVVLWTIGIYGATVLGSAEGTGALFRGMGVVLSAVALNAFFLLSHEGHHDLLAARPRANRAANLSFCLILLHAPTAYRVLHERHHRFLGGPGDPDEYRNVTNDARVLWLMHWMRLLLGTILYMLLIPLVAWKRADVKERRRIFLEYSVFLVVWLNVFVWIPLSYLVWGWLIPGVLVGYFSAVRALAQHALTTPSDPLLASRSVRSGRLVSFLLLNENHHLEHHLFPEVPSYNLPRLRDLLAPRIPYLVEDRSYTRFFLAFLGRFLRNDDSVLGRAQRTRDPHAGAP